METQAFAQDLLDRLPSTNGASRLSHNQLRERQVRSRTLFSTSFESLSGARSALTAASVAQDWAAVASPSW